MSMSALVSTLRGPGRQQLFFSTTAMTVRQATGSHLLRIPEFTKVRNMVAMGMKMRSSRFAVCGHNWRIKCFPNGFTEEHEASHISLSIDSASSSSWTSSLWAKAQMSVLDHAGTPCYTQSSQRDFSFTWSLLEFVRHEDLDKEKHLKDDCLTILCDLTVTVKVAPMPPFALRGQLAEAIWSKERPNVKIEVGHQTFAAHRWILEARSPVFKADLSIASRINDHEDTDRVLRVDDMDPQVFKALLQFVYTDSPPETSLLEEAWMAEGLLVAADRYELEKLKRICEEALCRRISMGSVADTLELADRHRFPVLWDACMRLLSSPGNLEAFMAAHGFRHYYKTGLSSQSSFHISPGSVTNRD
ncbi:BTB/POZ and MATH domain-containing protein 3-like [Aegilops tauschii subsp. strangulata]|uniref:BTB/POZ and MATH domain-containing protein 3-like n=1 Tax=Aegilops tauschii subsp. strangulata TaxID=200361 RepID=UPI003CC8C0CB